MNARELVNRYVHEVGRHLPRRSRADVEAELASLLGDELKERAARAGRALDEALAVELLRGFGKPEEVALRYRPARYLIGPDQYPAFMLVLKIVLSVLAGIYLLGLAYGWSRSSSWPGSAASIGGSLAELVGYALVNLGLLVVIFAVIGRFERRRPEAPAEWDPRKLPAVEDRDKISRPGLVAGIVLTALAIAAFNASPRIFAFFVVVDGVWGEWPVFTEEFQTEILPWLTALWALEIVLKLVVLRQGRWGTGTRWAEFALNLGSIALLYRALTGGALLEPGFFNIGLKAVLSLVLVIASIEALVQLFRLLGRMLRPRPAVHVPLV